MDQLPLVSIVTPSFNQAAFLRATIESVLGQSYPRIEYLVMDGGSTDGSVEIIREYSGRLAYWQSAPDEGQATAINAGWRRANGEILAYLNSDDVLTPDAVQLSVQALLNCPEAGLSYGTCVWVNEQGREIGRIEAAPFTLKTLVLQNRLAQPSVFVRRAALDWVGLLDPTMHFLMDYDLWLRIAMHFPVIRIPHILARFRLHDDSKTAQQYRFFLDDNLRLLDKAFRDPAMPRELVGMRPRAENYAFVLTGLHCYSLGRADDGREIFRRLFERCPNASEFADDIVSLFANHLVHLAPLKQAAFSPVQSEEWLDAILNDLPVNAQELTRLRSQVLAQAHVTWGFAAHAGGDKRKARQFMLRAVEYQPSRARNRGVLSVLVQSFRPA
ncbi:MAG: glycosyltransferase [Anaerolineae bacterium]|nr:glycosyltransferase [Anaerolineae bacterium]